LAGFRCVAAKPRDLKAAKPRDQELLMRAQALSWQHLAYRLLEKQACVTRARQAFAR
jgi:hypothetical protein